MSYELFIAKRYLRSKQTSGFISAIAYIAAGGVVLGVAALIIMLSVTNGFSGEVKDRLIGMNAHVTVQKYYGEMVQNEGEILAQVEQFAGVKGATPVIESKMVIAPKRGKKDMDGVVLWGIDSESFGRVSDLPKHLVYDRDKLLLGDLPEQKYPGIVLGEQLARRMVVGPGDEVLLVSFQNLELEDVMMGGTPKLWAFIVTDTFESGMYHYDDNFAFISLQDAQRIMGIAEGVTNIHIRVQNVDQAVQIGQALDAELGYPYRVSDWTRLFPELFRWMELEKWVIFIALSLIIVVAAFNIMSILVMSILIKTPEIGILRTMGAAGRGIRRIFVYQGLAIGVVGTALGCAIGLGVCLVQQHFQLISIPGDIYIISSLPVDMQVLDFLLVSLVSLGICLLASIYPARKAAALMPVDAIRYIM
ncbi:MAG: lipoprotein-releasing system transmembrane subunit LolC [Gemmatimonadetes bacterium]|nr:lipoprotein-releasing system transmembrane subunit LolC [Gemmatimonadota bacterium]